MSNTPGRAIARGSLLLALVALCTTVIVAGIHRLTGEAIARQARLAQQKVLLDIIPAARHDNAMLDDTVAVGPRDGLLGLAQERQIHIARLRGQAVAAIVPVVAPDGFSGDIDMLVGVNRDGSIAAVRVLAHTETPGLGDKIELERSDWILGFNGRSLGDPPVQGWAVRKDHGAFDQLTGATITPRAVVNATLRALQFAQANQARLFGDTPAGSE